MPHLLNIIILASTIYDAAAWVLQQPHRVERLPFLGGSATTSIEVFDRVVDHDTAEKIKAVLLKNDRDDVALIEETRSVLGKIRRFFLNPTVDPLSQRHQI